MAFMAYYIATHCTHSQYTIAVSLCITLFFTHLVCLISCGVYLSVCLVQLVDDVDLVWDDGVAPEPAIDVELPNVPLSQVLTLQLTFALLILGSWGVATWLDPADRKPIAPRRLALPTREEMEFDDDHGRARLD